MADWATVTVVLEADGVPGFMKALSHHEEVRFAASEDGVTPQALELGADPDGWEPPNDKPGVKYAVQALLYKPDGWGFVVGSDGQKPLLYDTEEEAEEARSLWAPGGSRVVRYTAT